jgi:predicted kinase
VQLRCTAAAETTERRLATRTHTASDATAAIAAAMAHTADPWPEAVCAPTHGSVADSLAFAAAAWRDATQSRPQR